MILKCLYGMRMLGEYEVRMLGEYELTLLLGPEICASSERVVDVGGDWRSACSAS